MNCELCKKCKHRWILLKNLHRYSYVIDQGFKCNIDERISLKDVILIGESDYDILEKHVKFIFDCYKDGWLLKNMDFKEKNDVTEELKEVMNRIEIKDKRCPYWIEHQIYDDNCEFVK